VRGSLILVLALLASAHAGPDSQTLRAVKAAIAKLRSRDAETRVQGALELAYYRAASKSAVPHLAKALVDPEDWRVRSAARQALAAIGEAGLPGLMRALKSRDPAVREAVCDVLRDVELLRYLEPHGKKLAALLKDSDLRVRRSAVFLFGAWGGPAIDHLLPVLGDSKPHARRAAVDALARAAVDSVGRLSVALEEERKPLVREGVCIVLGRLGKKAALAAPALAAALRDPNEGVRAEAARAIGRTMAESTGG